MFTILQKINIFIKNNFKQNLILKDKIKIEKWLNKYHIKNYELIPDEKYGYVVNVNGSVNLNDKKLKSIDVKFNKIDGSFNCSLNKLKSLYGCPNIIEGDFHCNDNSLISLQYCPQIINGNFYCYHNKLKTLLGCPKKIQFDFWCNGNELETLIGCPEKVNGNFHCSHNNLISLLGCPNEINGDFYCQQNQLNSLNHSPQIINGHFNCSYNQLISLNGITKNINGSFYCSNNKLNNLIHFPIVIYDTNLKYNDLSVEALINLPKELKINFFYLFGNIKLGELQYIENFNELTKILTIYKEKIKLDTLFEKNITDKYVESSDLINTVENLNLLKRKNKIIKL